MTQELPREVCQEVCWCNEPRNLNDVLLNLRRGFLTLMLFVPVKMLQDWHAVVCARFETFIHDHVQEFMTRTRSLNTMSAEPFDLLLKPYAIKSRTCLLNSFNKRLQKRFTTDVMLTLWKRKDIKYPLFPMWKIPLGIHDRIHTPVFFGCHATLPVLPFHWAEKDKSFLAPIRSQNGGDRLKLVW